MNSEAKCDAPTLDHGDRIEAVLLALLAAVLL
jgi:hypothetical protein